MTNKQLLGVLMAIRAHNGLLKIISKIHELILPEQQLLKRRILAAMMTRRESEWYELFALLSCKKANETAQPRDHDP